MSIFDSAKHSIEHAINSLGDSVKHSINDLGNSVKHDVYAVRDAAKKEVADAENAAKHAVATAENDAKKAVADAAHEAMAEFNKVKAEITSAAAKHGLEIAVAVIEVAAPRELDVKLGPVTVAIDSIPDRIATLRKWAANPPTGSGHIKQIIEELAPTSVSLEASIGLGFIVQSDDLEIGFTATYDTAVFLDNLEHLIEVV